MSLNLEQFKLIQELWNHFIEFGYLVRTEGRDGLKEWVNLKQDYQWLEKSQCLPKTVNLEHSTIHQIIQTFIVYHTFDVNHDQVVIDIPTIKQSLHNHIDYEHFFIQHFRIPIMTNYHPPLIKLFQIAYNVGQMKGSQNQYTKEQWQFYNEHHLNQLVQYIHKD